MKIKVINSLLGAIAAGIAAAACHGREPKLNKAVEYHQVELHRPGSLLYIDRIAAAQVVQAYVAGSFAAFKIGFYDSLPGDAKREKEKNIHLGFAMDKDWKALYHGDSITPVFLQPATTLDNKRKEVVLVFEVPDGMPDTLFYNDALGEWEPQMIILNHNDK